MTKVPPPSFERALARSQFAQSKYSPRRGTRPKEWVNPSPRPQIPTVREQTTWGSGTTVQGSLVVLWNFEHLKHNTTTVCLQLSDVFSGKPTCPVAASLPCLLELEPSSYNYVCFFEDDLTGSRGTPQSISTSVVFCVDAFSKIMGKAVCMFSRGPARDMTCSAASPLPSTTSSMCTSEQCSPTLAHTYVCFTFCPWPEAWCTRGVAFTPNSPSHTDAHASVCVCVYTCTYEPLSQAGAFAPRERGFGNQVFHSPHMHTLSTSWAYLWLDLVSCGMLDAPVCWRRIECLLCSTWNGLRRTCMHAKLDCLQNQEKPCTCATCRHLWACCTRCNSNSVSKACLDLLSVSNSEYAPCTS